MKRWALLFVRKDGVPTSPQLVWMDMPQDQAEVLAKELNLTEELSRDGLYYAVEIEDE